MNEANGDYFVPHPPPGPFRNMVLLCLDQSYEVKPTPDMHLLKPGLVRVNGSGAPGHVLFTDSSLFAFHSRNGAAMAGGILGGLLGALIGGWIDSNRAKKSPPEHLNHPEILPLDPSTRKQLLTAKLLCVIPVKDGLTAKPIGGGFTFTAKDHPEVLYKGLIHKKRVLAYLNQRGIPVVA
jgi:hypothetical protein